MIFKLEPDLTLAFVVDRGVAPRAAPASADEMEAAYSCTPLKIGEASSVLQSELVGSVSKRKRYFVTGPDSS